MAILRKQTLCDDSIIARRLGWQLCGRHQTIDVIAGDLAALGLLAQVLQTTLGPGGVRLLAMAQGTVKAQNLADGLGRSRLCLWSGADTNKGIPVWEIAALVNHADPGRPGNLLLLVSDWPEGWESLDHRIASKCGWAWRVRGKLAEQDIDPNLLMDENAKQFLLAKLVEGAVNSHREFLATKVNTSIGDPGHVASTEYSRACAEEMRVAGGNHLHRALYAALRYTGDARDIMTWADVDDALRSAGEETIPHHVIGKVIGTMWQGVETGRKQIEGVQTRVIQRVAPRTLVAEES